jgi:ankyrin repeat protein
MLLNIFYHMGQPKCWRLAKTSIADANINADNNGALREASANGHLNVVKYLIEHGAVYTNTYYN